MLRILDVPQVERLTRRFAGSFRILNAVQTYTEDMVSDQDTNHSVGRVTYLSEAFLSMLLLSLRYIGG